MRLARHDTWKKWGQMMVVHAVSLIDDLAGLLTLGLVDTELRPMALFKWFD